jgi:hypothetical protein
VTTSVSQPPSPNFSNTVMARMIAHGANPTAKTAARRTQPREVLRSAIVFRVMPNSDSENVRRWTRDGAASGKGSGAGGPSGRSGATGEVLMCSSQ